MVVIDNLPAHKGEEVKKIIQATVPARATSLRESAHAA
jgi:hypothetical protein